MTSLRPATLSPAAPRRLAAILSSALALLIVLSACTVRLAPEFDRSIVEGLGQANERTMTLFAAVAGGPAGDTFDQREPQYARVIGQFEALRVQANSRPVPQSLVAQLLGAGNSEEQEPDAIERLQSPTPSVLEQIVALLTRMQDTDKSGTLTETKVEGFKNSYETGISQALIYEKALER